jgi:hypothetical protein
MRGFQKYQERAQIFSMIFSFDLNEFSMEILFNIQ